MLQAYALRLQRQHAERQNAVARMFLLLVQLNFGWRSLVVSFCIRPRLQFRFINGGHPGTSRR